LLDIQLADGLSFEIFNQIELQSPVIFTTAYDEFAIKAFEINSLDYLLKPIKKEKLQKSLSKYQNIKEYFSNQKLSGSINKILENFNQKKSGYRNRFLVNLGSRLIPVSINEVAFFYAEDKIVFLVTQDDKKYMVNYSLEKLEEELDPTLFFRQTDNTYYLLIQYLMYIHILIISSKLMSTHKLMEK
jgi:two-component system response regulator LytT